MFAGRSCRWPGGKFEGENGFAGCIRSVRHPDALRFARPERATGGGGPHHFPTEKICLFANGVDVRKFQALRIERDLAVFGMEIVARPATAPVFRAGALER